MKLTDSIKYSLTKTIRDKKNIYFIIILIICSLLATGAISFSIAFFTNSSNSKYKDKIYRVLYLVPNNMSVSEANTFIEENKTKVESMEHIVELLPNIGFIGVDAPEFKTSIHDGYLELVVGSEKTLPENIIGERFSSTDSGVAICPTIMYPGSMDKYPKGEKDIFINGYDLLDKTIEVNVDSYDLRNGKVVNTGKYKKQLKVIGLYDSNESSGWLFQCYATEQDVKELYDENLGKLSNPEGEAATVPSLQVLVDEYDNVEKVKEELINMGFYVDYSVETDKDFENSIKLSCLAIVIVSIISIIFLTTSYVKKKSLNDSMGIGIIKSIGYSKKDIIMNNAIQTIIMSMISYIMSIIIFLIGIFAIKKIMYNYFIFTQHGYYLDQYILTYILSLLIVVILPIISSIIYTNKMAENSSMTIIKGEL